VAWKKIDWRAIRKKGNVRSAQVQKKRLPASVQRVTTQKKPNKKKEETSRQPHRLKGVPLDARPFRIRVFKVRRWPGRENLEKLLLDARPS